MPVSLSGSVLITGSITTSGTITAQTLVVQTITSSIVNMTGSNIFGSQLTDRQTFTGSMFVTGSITGIGATFSGNTNNGSGAVFPRLQVENLLATQGDGSTTFNFADIRVASGNSAVQMFMATSFAAGTWEPQGLINVSTNHPLIIRTNNTERMRISAAGTASFTANTLTSAADAGTITLKQNSTTANTGIYLERSGEQKGYYIYVGGGVDSLTFQRNNAGTKADVMCLTRDGNVGIGTTTPTDFGAGYTNLHVSASSNDAFILTSNNAGVINQFRTIASVGGVGTRSSHDFAFTTNNTERMRISSGGAVAINSTSYAIDGANQKLYLSGSMRIDVRGVSYGEGLIINMPADGTNYGGIFYHSTSASGVAVGSTSIKWGINYNYMPEVGVGSGNLTFVQANTNTRMMINSSGIIIIGTTSANNSSTNLQVEGTAGFGQMTLRYSNAASGRHWRVGPDSSNNFIIYNENNIGAYIGYSATSWTANSDERLKNINSNIENAIKNLMTLRTVNYSWKSDKSKKENLGLIAQDVEKVFPQLIDINNEGMLGVRYTDLIPVLVKAIQELSAKVTALENK